MGDRGLLIIQIRSHISDVRIGQTDNLSGVARVRKNFLVSGKAGVENNFAATPRDSSRGASSKNSSIFECKYALPFDSFCQRSLQRPYFSDSAEIGMEPKWSTGQYANTALP